REPRAIREGILLQIFLTGIVRKSAHLLIKIINACANSFLIPTPNVKENNSWQIASRPSS
ncbi:MAG: hypothetical protein WAN50_03860, partial [Minisyncoccia bacterium]